MCHNDYFLAPLYKMNHGNILKREWVDGIGTWSLQDESWEHFETGVGRWNRDLVFNLQLSSFQSVYIVPLWTARRWNRDLVFNLQLSSFQSVYIVPLWTARKL
ncbi:hypothetical protein QE152_g5035 [Popillia japonica]|uniref:Uncharacterized protein n=1 Tax=Popillia japonica TaxID=7064 RepID=A0AAW1MYG5_POPJA